MSRSLRNPQAAALCVLIAMLTVASSLVEAPGASAATTNSTPAVATVSLVGGTGVTGPLTKATIRCALPTITGPEILVIGTPADTTLSVRIMVLAGNVTVGVDTGAGPQYRERDFASTKVKGFRATRGVTLDASLTAVPPPAGTAVPNLPSIESIKGNINCGGQTQGTSTLTFSGKTENGKVSGRLEPVNVSCVPGPALLIIGLVKVGGRKALIDMSVRTNLFSFFLVPASGAGQQYMAPAGTATAVVASTAQVKGNAVEEVAAGTSPHTLHVVGHATCGRNPTG